MTSSSTSNIINGCLRWMLRPVMRFCLRRSLYIQDVLESVKVVFLDVAQQEAERAGEKVNVSRLSVMTGLHRRDVMRIYRENETIEEPRGLVSRVIGQWQQDKRFATSSGRPKVLSIDGDNSEFKDLVSRVSNDLNPGTVLFELERINAVERTRNGVKLCARAYVPKGNAEEGYRLLAEHTDDLMSAVEQNIFDAPDVPNLHTRTHYDNIPANKALEIRKWFNKEGAAFHQKARNFLSKYDRDINPSIKKSGGKIRVSLGTFGFIAENQEESRND